MDERVYTRLIAADDGSEEGRDALSLARMLAGATGASILAARVARSDEQAAAETLAAQAARALPGMDLTSRLVQGRSAAPALRDLAVTEQADLLVLGSCHRGSVGRALLGSTGERLLRDARCAIAVAPRGYRTRPTDRPRVIAVGFNQLPEAGHALAYASALAEACGAALRVLAVDEQYHKPGAVASASTSPDGSVAFETDRQRLEHALAAALDALPRAVRAQGAVLTGPAAETLAGETDKGMDLLVLGPRGHSTIGRMLLGSTSSKLMLTSACPVLAVPAQAIRPAAQSAGEEEPVLP